MRRSLVIGNWKMHGSQSANTQLLGQFLFAWPGSEQVSVAVCPPSVYLLSVADALKASNIGLGAQNVCAESADSGAYTGEVSAAMLADVGVSHVLVGHSERRQYYGETDAVVADKFIKAQEAGLIPVLCVGESLQQREQGNALAVIAGQIEAVVQKTGIEAFSGAVIAYEPVWAIGTGHTASPQQAQEVHAHIRAIIGKYDQRVAGNIQLLYGGSVKADNAPDLFVMADIDGALVGGASLKADEFYAICKAAE